MGLLRGSQQFNWPTKESWNEKHLGSLVPEAPSCGHLLRSLAHGTYQANPNLADTSPDTPVRVTGLQSFTSGAQPGVADGFWPGAVWGQRQQGPGQGSDCACELRRFPAMKEAEGHGAARRHSDTSLGHCLV